MSRLTDLIAETKAKDPQLAADLEREFRALSSRLPFGLNFERHRPEAVELPLRPVRKGDKVRVLPERGSTKKGDHRLWQVVAIHGKGANRETDLQLLNGEESETQRVALEDVVVVAEFKDIIYPGLVSTGKVERGGDRPYHTVINGENYHALKALTWSHRGKVDAIYIDPPYNTGAKDWKYNNDYVENDDLYRHSKWLAFMERRLLLAKELLKPNDSVLIVTIDEKEFLRLGLLLEQIFGGHRIQMVTIVINPLGQERAQQLSRVEEYAFFVFLGSASPAGMNRDYLSDSTSFGLANGEYEEVVEEDRSEVEAEVDATNQAVRWERLLRGGADATRRKSPDLFYPVFVDPTARRVVSVGDALPADADWSSVRVPAGQVAVWPLRTNGAEGRWRCSPQYFSELLQKGFAKVGTFDKKHGRWTLLYLGKAQIKRVESGEIEVIERGPDGSVVLGAAPGRTIKTSPKTVWNSVSHKAGRYGTELNSLLIPGRAFPFPKSLYAVEDTLRVAVAEKPTALILDFFAGSGTTAHAVMRLNRQDGGLRQCISISNNEVAADEHRELRSAKLRPGDSDWEKWGICNFITQPRIAAAIVGKTANGDPIRGDYKFTDIFPMSEGFKENAEFFTLTYETPVAVSYHLAFARVAPLLWIRAGSRGQRIEKLPDAGWAVAEAYGILVELDQATPFLKAVSSAKDLTIAFIVTDDERRFQAIARRLREGVEPVRLYESYLSNFAFSNGGEE